MTVNTFVWYSLLYAIFPDFALAFQMSSIEKSITIGLFFVGIALSAFLGARWHMRSVGHLFSFWLTTGIISTLSLTQMADFLPLTAFATASLLGISIGLGIPSCLAYFCEFTSPENRGVLGGLVWSASGFLILALSAMFSGLSVGSKFFVLALWRGLGLVAPVLLIKEEERQDRLAPSYSAILMDKSFTLYLLPWIMFCLVNWTEAPIVENLLGQDFFSTVIFIQFALIGFFAFLGGFFSDRVGRKPLIIIGFIILGVEYALLGLFSNISATRYLYICLDSLVWGLFAAVFFMALWGDLAEERGKERFYLLGGLPYLLAGYLSILVEPYVAQIPINAAFSLASFFLFLAVLPLLYAHETLPEKTIKERELKSYVEKAKKTKKKYVQE
jgi:hypothetical protein